MNRKKKTPRAWGRRLAQAGWRRCAALSGGAALLLVLAGYTQLCWPYNERLRAERATLDQLRARNVRAQLVQETQPAFLEEYRQARAALDEARTRLPQDTKLSEVLANIQRLARDSQVQMTLFDASALESNTAVENKSVFPTPPASGPGNGGKAIPVNNPVTLKKRAMPARLTGKHPNIMRFLRELARFHLILHIQDVTLASLGATESVNLKFLAYEAPPGSQIPSDPPGLARP